MEQLNRGENGYYCLSNDYTGLIKNVSYVTFGMSNKYYKSLDALNNYNLFKIVYASII